MLAIATACHRRPIILDSIRHFIVWSFNTYANIALQGISVGSLHKQSLKHRGLGGNDRVQDYTGAKWPIGFCMTNTNESVIEHAIAELKLVDDAVVKTV